MIRVIRNPLRTWALFAALAGLALPALRLRAAPDAGADGGAPSAAPQSNAQIRSGWDYSPYRITVYVKLDADSEWTAERRAALLATIQSRASAVVGGLWQLKAVEAPAELHWNSAAEIERVTSNSLSPAALEGDKVFLLGVGPMNNGRRQLSAREYDIRTENWGRVQDAGVPGWAWVDAGETLVEALVRTFRWLGRIDEISDQGTAVMRIRGGGLPAATATHLPNTEQQVFRPLVRHFDAAGRTAKNGVFPIDWTWLLPTSLEGAAAKCLLVSGVQDPLELKLDGRTEYLALSAPTYPGSRTELIVQARGADRPLEDAEVFALCLEEKSPQLVGRTDARGAVTVKSRGELEMILVRSGDDLLARFPLLPGFERTVVARVEDNGQRLESGMLVDRLSEELLDLAVQQAMLKARFQRQVVHGNLDAAERTLAALKSLKTSDAFLKAMDERKSALAQIAADQAAGEWLDKHLAEIKPLAAKFLLDAQGIARLEGVLTAIRGR